MWMTKTMKMKTCTRRHEGNARGGERKEADTCFTKSNFFLWFTAFVQKILTSRRGSPGLGICPGGWVGGKLAQWCSWSPRVGETCHGDSDSCAGQARLTVTF